MSDLHIGGIIDFYALFKEGVGVEGFVAMQNVLEEVMAT